MRSIPRLAVGLLLLALAVGVGIPAASADVFFYHSRGLLMSTYPYQILVFWTEETHTAQLIVIVSPPFYFVEDLDHFDTVTLTATLTPRYLMGSGEPLQLLDGTAQWTNVEISQDGDGAIVGGLLYHTVTFDVKQNTASGYYTLKLNGEATATMLGGSTVKFVGFDQIGVSFRPGDAPNSGWGL